VSNLEVNFKVQMSGSRPAVCRRQQKSVQN